MDESEQKKPRTNGEATKCAMSVIASTKSNVNFK